VSGPLWCISNGGCHETISDAGLTLITLTFCGDELGTVELYVNIRTKNLLFRPARCGYILYYLGPAVATCATTIILILVVRRLLNLHNFTIRHMVLGLFLGFHCQ